ncbi:hypothetical protein EV130_101134 [Rhizobium azibense]|uniref:Uncharacterized protein n=1 Tax=Rhizobium azibense TaxID=1136135 RepID=A0A4R3R5Z9_9HYPH|nr:hypothetical protein [Rhizobium azibense]TCU30563.1 hypothetical protein EV130_101134 [Rhizobium azibense]
MSYYTSTIAVLAIGCTALIAPLDANALDIGGKNGVSVSGSRGGVNASVGGAKGVNASVSRSSSGGVGADASLGGSGGINSSTSLSGRNSALDVSTAASIGGSNGVNADVDASLGGSRLATASATLGVAEDALVESTIGPPSEDAVGSSGVRAAGSIPRSTFMALNEMSAIDKAKAKLRCKDVLRSGGFDASLVKLCKMVVAMR